MSNAEIAAALLVRPRQGMAEAVRRNCAQTLGPEFCLYRRVSSACVDTPGCGWPGFDAEPRKGWVAECRCGACGEVWHGGWVKGGEALLLSEGEDGIIYPGVPELDAVEYGEGHTITCPFCEETVELIRAKKLKSGRTYRQMVGSLENVGPYTVILQWMAERYVHSDGSDSFWIYPQNAAVIGVGGKLAFFRYDGDVDRWMTKIVKTDPFQSLYGTYGAINNRTVGAWLWEDVPEQLGKSGEKTGIADYFRGGGAWPVLYLRAWDVHPNIENLVKAGWLRPFEQSIDNEVGLFLRNAVAMPTQRERKLYAPLDFDVLANWDRAKPTEMIGLTRQELRSDVLRRWNWKMLGLWVGLVAEGLAAPGDALFLDTCRESYGLDALRKWADMASENRVPASLVRIHGYCKAQARKGHATLNNALSMYLDYLEMLNEPAPTPLQVFPPNLRAAHDRAMDGYDGTDGKHYLTGFLKIFATWRELEWSDGRICAVLPRSNADLQREGKKLNHCVGGYGKSHVAGKLIVFIRHARRPERPWFTLNIDTTGAAWSEIQLHGYGNEWAHGHTLRIPGVVREFVDRWEREVLGPVFTKVKAEEKRSKRKETKTA